jgi:hypothetical protein
MNSLPVKSARKILGKCAQEVSDEQLEEDIKQATLLKDMFFDNYLKNRKKLNQQVISKQ